MTNFQMISVDRCQAKVQGIRLRKCSRDCRSPVVSQWSLVQLDGGKYHEASNNPCFLDSLDISWRRRRGTAMLALGLDVHVLRMNTRTGVPVMT